MFCQDSQEDSSVAVIQMDCTHSDLNEYHVPKHDKENASFFPENTVAVQ
jgi:hypothetical protein